VKIKTLLDILAVCVLLGVVALYIYASIQAPFFGAVMLAMLGTAATLLSVKHLVERGPTILKKLAAWASKPTERQAPR